MLYCSGGPTCACILVSPLLNLPSYGKSTIIPPTYSKDLNNLNFWTLTDDSNFARVLIFLFEYSQSLSLAVEMFGITNTGPE